MRKTTYLILAAILILAFTLSLTYAAQGPGCAKDTGTCKMEQPCHTGKAQGTAQAGWWNNITPKTPAQKAFVTEVKSLHGQLQAKQLELAKLKADKAPAAKINTTQKELDSLRVKMQNTMHKNREMCQQMGVAVCANCCVDGKCKCCADGKCCVDGKCKCFADGKCQCSADGKCCTKGDCAAVKAGAGTQGNGSGAGHSCGMCPKK